ncbi:restriction endonuclease subunit S [Flavobacterium sp. FPG59]|uniref:restriction endonuclease subunit S n=1 Tax=Flavobacterium sp. FPG59 TaxID=1929267 RepID=UPI000A3B374A|nr:restriction endonuclease subunit S [Flavobacterium sp. FPG59]OUD35698.1 restriction endonuclease [Flavobacterium sp. FPG59]|tara:strand:- start:3243 stop:4406 length:1164 start_codon:yes stop_codon:yes gene_type:complete
MSYLEKLLEGIEVEWRTLGDVLTIKNGKDYKSFQAGNIPVYGSGGIMTFIDTPIYDKPSVLIPRKGSLSKLYYVNVPFWTVDTIFWTDINITITEPKFVYYYLQTQHLEELNMAGGVPSLTQTILNKVPIPIPPLEVQKEIVHILDTFTELTSELTSELTAEFTARKKQNSYYREQLFSFENEEVEWKILIEIGKFQRGKRFVKADMILEGVPCIHYGEMYTHYGTWANESKSFISDELFENKKLRVAEKGDVVIVAAGETIEDLGKGTAWLGDEGVVIHDACFSYKSSLNPKYFAYFTRTKQYHDQIKRNISSGKISAIHSKGLSNVIIPVPSPEEQERIVTILDKFDSLTNSISEVLPKEIALRKKQYEYYRSRLLTFPKNNLKA